MIEKIKATRLYLDYLEEHYYNVQKAWKELQYKCSDMYFIYDDYLYNIIDSHVKNHDDSKLSKEELVQYRERFYPVNSNEEGGLDNSDKEIHENFNNAWKHHKELNPHHWENWATQELNKGYCSHYGWQINCVHMIIDWMSMGYKFGDTAQEYYEKNCDRTDNITLECTIPAHNWEDKSGNNNHLTQGEVIKQLSLKENIKLPDYSIKFIYEIFERLSK